MDSILEAMLLMFKLTTTGQLKFQKVSTIDCMRSLHFFVVVSQSMLLLRDTRDLVLSVLL